ncbi:MAG: hypothetical protein U1E51_27240 [Candidatus Binatia bacterium]|nr:hypothetical protein [Candidatus Binatia bacterium]
MEKLFDVIAVNFNTMRVRLFSRNRNSKNAEAIINMAVIRRGVDEEFYTEVVAGKYQEGDEYKGKGEP